MKLLAVILLTASVALAQTTITQAEFEVASVKPSAPGGRGGGIMPGPDGLTARSVTLYFCIGIAYDVQDYQISGPGWLNSQQYDIAAKAAGPVDLGQLRLMLQNLLAKRFQLALHRETKTGNVYTLVVGVNGSKLQKSTEETRGGTTAEMGHLAFRGVSMPAFARRLSQQLHEPVLDMTGLKENYDFTLDWQQGDDAGGASLFTAVQEQLGLKLEAKKTPIEMLVVDHAEKVPTEN